MRKPLTLLALTAILVALGSLTALAGAARPGPSLTILKRHPLTVAGRHFKPHSHVRVTLTSATQTTKRVTVGGSGQFTVRFTQTLDRCTQWTVKVALTGRAPLVVRGPKPQCAPAGGY